MPFYEYECEKCGWIGEDFAPTAADRSANIRCADCGGRAKFILSATKTDFHHTEKEIRIPTNPTKVWMGGKRGT